MLAFKITDDIYSVGALNPNMRIFDVVMKTDYGTSYNSYIVKGKEKIALVETCHATYFDIYLDNIKQVCALEDIDYIILNHCEPDHSGALARLMSECKNAKIIVSKAGSVYLKNITNLSDLPITAVKDGDSLDLGGKELKFISAPFLHWPDSMFTWLESEGILFSCDFLGSHYCEPYTLDTNIAYPKKYESAFENYFNAIFSPFKPYVQAGLKKIDGLDIQTVCSSHGPILTKGGMLDYAVKKYYEWSTPEKKDTLSIPVFYCSAYSNTAKLANSIANGIKSVLSNAAVEVLDVNDYEISALSARLNSSDAFAVGSPTINSDAVAPIWKLLSEVDAINNKKKSVVIFGSYGWSGEAVPNIIARLNGLRMNVFEEGFKVAFVPSEDDLKNAEELGKRFAQSIKV